MTAMTDNVAQVVLDFQGMQVLGVGQLNKDGSYDIITSKCSYYND
jgi:hypothetical protein